MKLSESVKPISYLKAHASEMIHDSWEKGLTYVITHNGQARVVVQDVGTYEQTQESLALLKMLAQGSNSLKKGRYKPLRRAFEDLDRRIKALA